MKLLFFKRYELIAEFCLQSEDTEIHTWEQILKQENIENEGTKYHDVSGKTIIIVIIILNYFQRKYLSLDL